MLKQMRVFGLVVALALFLNACGGSQTNSAVLGVWLVDTRDIPIVVDDISMKVVVKIKIEENQVSSIAECSIASLGLSTSATAVAPAQVTNSLIIIKGEDSQQQTLNVRGLNVYCNIKVARKTLGYSVSGNTLTVTNPANGESETAQRVQ